MLLELKRAVAKSSSSSGVQECTALEKGIAQAQASMAEAGGSAEHADLRATLAAFIAQCEKRIAEIRAIRGR